MAKVSVITCSIGAKELVDAIESVSLQDYVDLEHVVVVNGKSFLPKVKNLLKHVVHNVSLITVPYNTGSNGVGPYRIYAASPFLINSPYICFLDEDNYYDFNHVSSMVGLIEQKTLDWCYSLRKIVGKNKEFICNDDCESLGKWPVWLNEGHNHVDTSAYMFKTDFFKKVSWSLDVPIVGDRSLYNYVTKSLQNTSFDCTGKYSLNYRLGGNSSSVKQEFFLKGNLLTKQKYPNGYPWVK